MTIENFYTELLQDVKSTQLSDEEGGSQEQIFSQIVLELIQESGDTEDARICFDRKEDTLGRTMHKINGYALYENYETLDLFITIYKGSNEIETVTKQEAESALNQLEKFFRNAVYKDYLKELEESSEVFDLAHTLAEVPEIKEFLTRVNLFIITNGRYKSKLPTSKSISGYNLFNRVIDIDYIYNISSKARIPLEIDFVQYGGGLPCVKAPEFNEEYESYLALIPGMTLAKIYEEFGPRLLEQNVRSFLQFTGKINQGIRKTIKFEPHMFLAFNNGIAATAEEVVFNENSINGLIIDWAKDFQIVNGGQTTASIFHTWKKEKADIGKIFVQIKLTVVKKRENFGEIVNRIAEYANTQNKVSASDLSSNTPFHIELEKISRSVWAPPKGIQSIQTRWFYERARGQYKNAKNKEGFTPAKRKAFDLRTPLSQVITKELLAKYINSYQELYHNNKLIIGPHVVVRGSQKNYAFFLNYMMPEKPDSIYFEDLVSKAILFRSAEKIYGVKPYAIGDMRYITVPYSISWIGHKTNNMLDLYKIWKNQSISSELEEILRKVMVRIDKFLSENAPGSLYGEWAKKEECWDQIKLQGFDIDLTQLKSDILKSKDRRKKITETEINDIEKTYQLERIYAIPHSIWQKIESWGSETNELTSLQRTTAFNMITKVRRNSPVSESERQRAVNIIDIVIEKAPDILFEIDNIPLVEEKPSEYEPDITLGLIEKMIAWDKKNKRLKDHHFRFMYNVIQGKTPFDERAKKYALNNLNHLKKFGFTPN